MIDLVCILTLRHCPHARDALFDCSLAASCHEYGSVTAALANPGTCKNEVKTLGKPSILGKPSMSLRIDLCVFLLPGTPANFSVSLCKTSPVVAMLDRTPLLTLPPSAETCPTSCGYSSDLLDHSLIARYSSRCVGKSPAGRIPDFRACICSLSQLDKLPTSSCLHSWHGRIRRQLAFGLFPTSTRRRGSMQDLGLRSASSYSSRILRHQGTVERGLTGLAGECSCNMLNWLDKLSEAIPPRSVHRSRSRSRCSSNMCLIDDGLTQADAGRLDYKVRAEQLECSPPSSRPSFAGPAAVRKQVPRRSATRFAGI